MMPPTAPASAACEPCRQGAVATLSPTTSPLGLLQPDAGGDAGRAAQPAVAVHEERPAGGIHGLMAGQLAANVTMPRRPFYG